MSSQPRSDPPSGTPQRPPGQRIVVPPELAGENAPLPPPTDDTPTIISRFTPTPPSLHTDDPSGIRGRRLAHFELIEPIGVGGMAAVLRARDTQLDRFVALKILPPEMAADPENVRFGGSPKHIAVLDVDGEPRAYAIYRLHVTFGDLGPETVLQTLEVMGVDSRATASIWRYLLDVDWTKTVRARVQPVDSPLFLLFARPNYSKPTLSDGLWVRLVEVEARRRLWRLGLALRL